MLFLSLSLLGAFVCATLLGVSPGKLWVSEPPISLNKLPHSFWAEWRLIHCADANRVVLHSMDFEWSSESVKSAIGSFWVEYCHRCVARRNQLFTQFARTTKRNVLKWSWTISAGHEFGETRSKNNHKRLWLWLHGKCNFFGKNRWCVWAAEFFNREKRHKPSTVYCYCYYHY